MSVRSLRARDQERALRAQLRVDRPLDVSFDRERVGQRCVGVATVFLTGAECPFSCVFCDLWQHTLLTRTPLGAIPQQIERVASDLEVRSESEGEAAPTIEFLKLYNASNFFDDRAVPEADDAAIVAAVESLRLPSEVRVVLECHPKILLSQAGRRRLKFYANAFPLEVAFGLESTAPGALEALMKGATLDEFARAFEVVRSVGASVRAFVLFGAALGAVDLATSGLSPADEQERSTVDTVRWARDHGARRAAVIPVRSGNGAMDRLAAKGVWQAPTLAGLESAYLQALKLESQDPLFEVHLDTWDLEAVDRGGVTDAQAACIVERLRRLNDDGFEQTERPKETVCKPMC